MTSPAVEAVGLSKRFGTREVLKGIDLRIAPGRVTGLVGPKRRRGRARSSRSFSAW
jgi:ABC-type multidrug transport system ATPase subunit